MTKTLVLTECTEDQLRFFYSCLNCAHELEEVGRLHNVLYADPEYSDDPDLIKGLSRACGVEGDFVYSIVIKAHRPHFHQEREALKILLEFLLKKFKGQTIGEGVLVESNVVSQMSQIETDDDVYHALHFLMKRPVKEVPADA